MSIPQNIISGQNILSENKPRLDDLQSQVRNTSFMLNDLDDVLTRIYFKSAIGEEYTSELQKLKEMLYYIKSQIINGLSSSMSEVNNNLQTSIDAIDSILDGYTPGV